jgi:uncharacterized pyridoxamine 5'-phosphate oxidase family protein
MKLPQDLVAEFLAMSDIGVLSTIDVEGRRPESAAIAYAQTNELKLILATSSSTRKWKNILTNPNVSFVVWKNNITVQYEGIAKELIGDERRRAVECRIAKLPGAAFYADSSDEKYIVVSPTWIRYSDTDISAGNVLELTF